MWARILGYAQRLFTLAYRINRNEAAIRELTDEMEEQRKLIRGLLQQIKHDHETQRHEREKQMLRVENELLRFERRLSRADD